MKHVFPDNITAHVLTLCNGSTRTVLVSPSETFGKALARLSIKEDDVKSVLLPSAPLTYEPDWSVGSR